MCGICGAVGIDDPALLTAINNIQTYRGPDDQGEYFNPETLVYLGHRRLSILDLAHGQQPMSNHDQTIWITYNGELFNSPELRQRLIDKGYQFQTQNSDTETFIHLYAEYGPEMVHHLNGMFAFVIYDVKRQKLFGARDRSGIKPLYYTQSGGQFLFASELKTLLKHPALSREINPTALYHYLSLLYVPGPDCIFQNIHRLPAGHCFQYDVASHQLSIERYWTPSFEYREELAADEWAERIRDGLQQSVKRWSLSDVPVACSLSGGIDSSAVVALLSQSESTPVKTFSLGFEGEQVDELNELRLARQVAEQYNTDHHELILNPDQLLDDLLLMAWHMDEPYGGGVPSWYVFQFMSEHVKVGFTGSGGDELFGNYGKWLKYENNRAVRWAKAAGALDHNYQPRNPGLLQTLGGLGGSKLSSAVERVLHPEQLYYLYMKEDEKQSVLAERFHSTESTAQRLGQLGHAWSPKHPRDFIMAADMQGQLPEEFLAMTDRFSMAHSLEARVPFLDESFVDTVFKIPPEIRTKPGAPKYLLKKAVADLLPNILLNARKRGFVLPLRSWLRNQLKPLVLRLFDKDRLRQQGVFQENITDRFITPHLQGQADYSPQVWSLLMFQLWWHLYIDNTNLTRPSHTWKDIC